MKKLHLSFSWEIVQFSLQHLYSPREVKLQVSRLNIQDMNFQKRDITIIQANIVRQIYQPWLLSNSCKFHFHSESEPGRICLTCPNQPVANFHPDTIPNQLIQLIPAQIHQHSYYMILTLFTIPCTTIRLQPQLFFTVILNRYNICVSRHPC